MSLISIREKLSEQGVNLPQFDLFGSASINIIHWQPLGTFGADYSQEIKNSDAEHYSKCESFIDIALEQDCSLLFTTEYSFPYQALINIINKKDRWPNKGAIWCLSMEGIKRHDFDSTIKQLLESVEIVIVNLARETILTERRFVSALIYLFLIEIDGIKKLCLIPQLKTHPSSDVYMEHESAHMCLGNVIYYFDDESGNAIFSSLICADSFNHDNVKLFDKFTNSNLLLFNPQLSYAFLHSAETEFFDSILNYRKERSLIIALNWSKGTSIPSKGAVIEHGYSTIIRKPFLKFDNTMIVKNYQKGVCFGNNGYEDIWYITCNEHVLLYRASSLVSPPAHAATTNFLEPLISDYFTYVDNRWVRNVADCIIDWNWFNSVFNSKKSISHECCEACGIKNVECLMCNKENHKCCCYKDIAMFTNSFFEQGIVYDNPFYVNKIGIVGAFSKLPTSFLSKGLDYNEIYEKKNVLEGISRTIKSKDRLPIRFKMFAESHIWVMGERTRNLRYNNQDGIATDAWIIFVSQKSKICITRSEINRRFSSDDDAGLRNRILLCYPDPEFGYLYHDDGTTDIRDAKIWRNTKINLEGVM